MRILLYVACCAALLAAVLSVAGCLPSQSMPFHVRIEPQRGHVPYEARVVCTPLDGTYTYKLPDGSTISNADGELDVLVDDLSWEIKVTWTDGEDVLVDTATAEGTNARPRILRPRISGSPELWYLEPRERTLIDFAHYEASMSGPETGVVYDGTWRVVEIRLDCPLKTVCGDIVADSVFYPPYERDTVHALYNGRLYENACIVYPTYTGEIAPNGLPYAPSAESGYTYDPYHVRALYHAVAFPAQSGRIHVTVVDDWDRQTTASFDIPIGAQVWGSELPPGHPGYVPPLSPDDAEFFVAGRNASVYHRSTCPEVCAIPARDRLYFAEQRNAQAAGLRPAAGCL